MTDNTLTTKQYTKLASDIQSLINESKEKIEEFAKSELTVTYWKIGQRIEQEKLTNKANYSSSILDDLSTELGIDKKTLNRSVQFFNTYPDQSKVSNLNWSSYKYLLTIKDDDVRIELEKQASEEEWSTMKIAKTVKSTKESDGLEDKKTKIKRPLDPSYIYKAKILEVIDGDTLLLNIDLGFQVIKEQRLRLTQIDAPEMGTKNGRISFEYLRNLCAKLDEIVVKTNKVDIYGRYLGDVFYASDPEDAKTQNAIFTRGIYLNEELVRKGFVEVI